MTSVVLLGGGGHASDVLGAIEAVNAQQNQRGDNATKIRVEAVLDEGEIELSRFENRAVSSIGQVKDIGDLSVDYYIAAVGYPSGRKALAEIGSQHGLEPLSIVHPRAWVPEDCQVGSGVIVLANASLSPLITLLDHCYVSHGVNVGHDTIVGAFASIMPGACISGDVLLGEGCLIGSGAVVLQGLRVGTGSTVGAGAVVTSDVPEGATVMGMPARVKGAG